MTNRLGKDRERIERETPQHVSLPTIERVWYGMSNLLCQTFSSLTNHAISKEKQLEDFTAKYGLYRDSHSAETPFEW